MANTNSDTITNSINFAEDFEIAKKFVQDIGARIPRRAIYWGIGAAVLGAAAVGVVMYRNRVNASNKAFDKSQDVSARNSSAEEFGKNPVFKNSREADPDFADTSVGRQPTPKSDSDFRNASYADRGLKSDRREETHH